MGVRLIRGQGFRRSAMYDSVSGFAFGPTFEDQFQAEAFLDAHNEKDGLPDLRTVTDSSLEAYVIDFKIAYEEWEETAMRVEPFFVKWLKTTDHWENYGAVLETRRGHSPRGYLL